jgi:hypothetical protein
MTAKKPPPVFLQRASYRQRRLRDGAKLLPVLGIVLWAMPLSWNSSAAENGVGSEGLLYVFGVWVFLIVLTFVLGRRLRNDGLPDEVQDDAPK